jgi:membrane fusion protein, multidrug efflux system
MTSVAVIQPETVTLVDDLPARVAALRIAEIRPQVGGIVEQRLFEQGSEVTAGQPLFQISPLPLKAEVDSAAAALERAEAALARAEIQFARTGRLVVSQAISREAHDDAVSQLAQSKAYVAEARATLQRRRLDLEFATVRAPIAGTAGPALVSEGALASVSDAKAMATIQQIDQVYVDVRQPVSRLEATREAVRSGELDDASGLPVVVVAASGKRYPISGRTLFSDISVDPTTGNVTVRVLVDNPERLLLPGMYVRAMLPRGIKRDALLVPQQAVLRDAAGRPQLLVVAADKAPERRAVEIGALVGDRYLVRSGLNAGDRVIVEGQERVRDRAVVDAGDAAGLARGPATE